MIIRQGDIFWLELPDPKGPEPGYRHPHVVVQNNIFNQSKIKTVVVCALTSNLNRASSPGNVALKTGEANLPKSSVVNITQLITVNKINLQEKIGSLSNKKVKEIISGINLLLEPRDIY